MIAFQTSIDIERPLEEVFAYVSDPGNFPSWNSAVRDVRPTSAFATGRPGSTYAMKRQLPEGGATNQLEILVREQPHEFTIRTTSGPTPFLYRYRFAVESGKTTLQLDAQVELDGVAALMPQQLACLAIKHGVDANLATLKRLLEERAATTAATTNGRLRGTHRSPPQRGVMTTPELQERSTSQKAPDAVRLSSAVDPAWMDTATISTRWWALMDFTCVAVVVLAMAIVAIVRQ